MTATTIAISIGSAFLGAVVGAWSLYYYGLRQDREVRRRERIVEHLIEAYENLEFGQPRMHENTSVREYTPEEYQEFDKRFNRAIVSINLMGSPEQVNLCRKISAESGVDFTELSIALRDSLREELNLEKLEVGHFWLEQRISNKSGRTT